MQWTDNIVRPRVLLAPTSPPKGGGSSDLQRGKSA